MKTRLKALATASALTAASVGVLGAPAGAETQTRSEDTSAAVAVAVDDAYSTESGDDTSQHPVVDTFIALAWCKKVGGEIGVHMCGTLLTPP